MKQNKKDKNEMLINVGVAIRKLRLKKGFKSAEMFSYENNLNRTAYWRWENGQNITMKNFFKICNIHKLSPREFFELFDKKYNEDIFTNHLNDENSPYTRNNENKSKPE